MAGPLSRLWWLRQKISLLGRGGDRDGGRGRGRGQGQGAGMLLIMRSENRGLGKPTMSVLV